VGLFVFVGFHMDDWVEVGEGVAEFLFELFRDLMGGNEGEAVVDLNVDIGMSVGS